MLSLHAGETHWLEANPLLRLYPDPSYGNRRSRNDVQNARNRLGGAGAPPGGILAELTFGFWAMVTANRLDRTVWSYLKQVLPAQTDRSQLHDSMMELDRARNRVTHHEPVRTGSVEVTLRRMKRIAGYVSAEFADDLDAMSTVRTLLAERP